MNVKDFISSGILEAYALGAATASERAEVEQMMANHPEVKQELLAIEDALNAYAQKLSVEPPAHLKDKVLNAIASAPRERHASSNGKEFTIGTAKEEKPKTFNILLLAAAVALLISIPLNLYLYSRISSDEGKIVAMNSDMQSISNKMQDSVLAYTGMRNKLYVLTDSMFRMIPLKGQKVAPDAKAMVCWCPGSKELYIEPEKMPAVPKGMQYQLWAIVDGKPVDAGMINMTAGMQKMKLIAHASAFAVTLEKEGGSTTPHGDMFVVGTI